MFVFDPTSTTQEVRGTVIGLEQSQGQRSTGRIYFVVKLDTGPVVIARAQGQIFRDKQKAVLAEETTALFRRKRYMFLQYAAPVDR